MLCLIATYCSVAVRQAAPPASPGASFRSCVSVAKHARKPGAGARLAACERDAASRPLRHSCSSLRTWRENVAGLLPAGSRMLLEENKRTAETDCTQRAAISQRFEAGLKVRRHRQPQPLRGSLPRPERATYQARLWAAGRGEASEPSFRPPPLLPAAPTPSGGSHGFPAPLPAGHHGAPGAAERGAAEERQRERGAPGAAGAARGSAPTLTRPCSRASSLALPLWGPGAGFECVLFRYRSGLLCARSSGGGRRAVPFASPACESRWGLLGCCAAGATSP